VNTIWFFGDCFTWGFGAQSNQVNDSLGLSHDPYFKLKKHNDKLWTEIVAEKLNMKEVKPWFGVGAFPWIIDIFLNRIEKMKSGDIVIFGDTVPDGVLAYNRLKDKVASLNCNDFHHNDCYFRSEEEKEKTLPFIEYHKIPHQQKWTEFYKNQVEKISKEILNRGIKTFYWSHDIWKKEDRFETITEATDGKIVDPHFSWNGHREMAEYILGLVKNDSYIGKKSLV